MSFVQAGFLIACATVAIPVLVHLLSRWQVRRLELGTMRFLQEVIHDQSRRRKIRRWLLLLTRAALLALLALLFARPFLPEQARRDGNRIRVVLIDRSASMGMPGKSGRLIDDAVGAAAESVATLGSDAIVVWAWFDRHVEPLPESTVRPSAPRAVVGDTNYLGALNWARDKIDAFPDAVADVVLVTDLQQSGLAADKLATEALRFPRYVPVRVIDVGRPAANNLAITNLAVPAKRIETQQDVELSVTLFNYGTLPFEEVPLTATAYDGSRSIRLKKSINIPGGQAEEVSVDFGKLDPGAWQITVAMDIDDDLAFDNRRFTALAVAAPIQLSVLDSGSSDQGVAAESYYLVTALDQNENRELSLEEVEPGTPGNRSRFHTEVVYLQDQAPRPFHTATDPLVVVADAAAVSPGTIGQLEKYVRSGGKLLVFAGDGDGDDPSAIWHQTGLAPGELKMPQRSGAMPFRIVSVTGGSMLGPFEDPQHGDLSRLSFQKLQPVEVDDTTNVLAWFDHGRPALTDHSLDEGRVVWFLASPDASWGSWANSPLYLPLVHQMAADLLSLTGEGPIRFRTIGQPRQRPPSTGNSINTVSFADDARQQNSQLVFAQPGFEQQDQVMYVVNGAAKESDPTRLESPAFVEHFGLTPAQQSDALISASVVTEKRSELWPWFAAIVFVLLVAEFGLANRTSA
jgi:hypothetical protein